MIVEVVKTKKDIASVAKAVQRVYKDAVANRNNKSTHFDKSITEVLEDCHKDRRGIISCDEAEIAAELSHLGLEFGRRKSGQAKDIFCDVVRHSIDQPIFEPTDIPVLPESTKVEILNETYSVLFGEGFAGNLQEDLIAPLKLEALAKQKESAAKKASLAEKQVRDALEEMDYDNEMEKIIDDVVSMPIAIANYPCYEYKEVPTWKKDEYVLEKKLVSKMKRVSPFDFYIIDGSEPRKSSGVIEVCRVHPSDLEGMKGLPDWFDNEIDEVVKKCAETHIQNIGSYKNQERKAGTLGTDEIEFIKFYGKLPRNLFDTKKIKLDDSDSSYVEMIVFVSGEKILYCKQQKSNSAEFRPYYSTSYEKLNGSAYGTGILQRVHKASRIARAMTYAMIRNAGYTARPTGEMDYARLTEFNNVADLKSLNIGGFFHVSPDVTGRQGGAKDAVSVYNIPNHMAQFQAGITFFLDLIDLLSAVPKISSGDMRGMATLGRSFRGIAMVQAAESKATKSALDNFDHDIQEPLFLAMYQELLQNTKNSNLKGDIRVKARGTSGYTTKESKAAAKQESLQFLAPFAAEMPPQLRESLLRSVMQDMGIDTERYYGGAAPVQSPLVPTETTTAPSFGGEKIPV